MQRRLYFSKACEKLLNKGVYELDIMGWNVWIENLVTLSALNLKIVIKKNYVVYVQPVIKIVR